jgi:hypothetical protein
MSEPPIIDGFLHAGGLCLVTGDHRYMVYLSSILHPRALAMWAGAGDSTADLVRLIDTARQRYREKGLPRPAFLLFLPDGHASYEFFFREADAVVRGETRTWGRIKAISGWPFDGLQVLDLSRRNPRVEVG